ncbi:hypothetical protein KC19_VG225300 [Ceratodon purpureus]|uniref:Uncharacterized protein n=1 Tax=Ceratodon purpureus TaxID=3225 RepID=A0A8T0HT73_CERPU|nr:hypothetical protein KC19_VG225300 [Ceratodon purpureus]
MELRSRKLALKGGEDTSSSSNTGDTGSSEDQSLEKEVGGEEDTEVPDYERQRQERMRQNSVKLAELGIRMLARALKSSTVASEAARGGGNCWSLKATPNPGATTLDNSQSTLKCEERRCRSYA